MIFLGLDTAAELAGAGIFDDGALIAEVSWRSKQNQSRELLPAIDWLLKSRGLDKSHLEAIVVCLGPGSYAGLRVGLSTAKGLAFGLDIPIAGIGRLAADAEPYAIESGVLVYPVQAAGRAELAWAAYARRDGVLQEDLAPRLSREAGLVGAAMAGSIALGEISAPLAADLRAHRVFVVETPALRVGAIGRLGAERLKDGDFDSVESLVPLYLREPAIGPQPPIP